MSCTAWRERHETLATAESLTGGLLAATIVEIPGVSGVYRGGLVVYATELKAALAGVPEDLLAERGPVDPDVAAALAEGGRRRCGADWGLATTGVAGPEPQDGKPVGLVYVAVAGPGGGEVRELRPRRRPRPHPHGRVIGGAAAARRADPRAPASRSGPAGSRLTRRRRWSIRPDRSGGVGCRRGPQRVRLREGSDVRPVRSAAPAAQRRARVSLRGGAMVLLRRVIGDALRARRQGQHRTLREVSTAANVSLGYLSEIERGQKEAVQRAARRHLRRPRRPPVRAAPRGQRHASRSPSSMPGVLVPVADEPADAAARAARRPPSARRPTGPCARSRSDGKVAVSVRQDSPLQGHTAQHPRVRPAEPRPRRGLRRLSHRPGPDHWRRGRRGPRQRVAGGAARVTRRPVPRSRTPVASS